MIDTAGKFYLGRMVDSSQGKTTDQPLLYDPDDLTTHAVVVGMTGSGKTGLCLDMLEEAALNNIPAIMIDPKGDITNLMLHFPDLLPQDFQPWINPDQARRDGLTLDQAAAQIASSWRNGLAEWGIEPERIRRLQQSATFCVYTPGSDSGLPVSILASLKAPSLAWDENRELLRERISSTVTALLGLAGVADIDPVRSREHILLANIFENAWKAGRDLDLAELILQTQTPPFAKLGVFDVNTFFPERDRFSLAMQLNNILAAPSFQAWIEGQELDIPSLLWEADGRPRHCIFYIAHLSDSERMFFVTLLYSAVETWMRTQGGSTSLRAIVYFDEIFGYLPPLSNPPSKPPMLRMLKQARAFGIGQVLVTQNPVDLDYKGLSNAGTWFIGKLQTERDKERLLDGLQGALGGGLDRGVYDKMLSALGKRVFLMHNVHNKQPLLFQTRWAMNYMAGPLTRVQAVTLNQLVGSEPRAIPQQPQVYPSAPPPVAASYAAPVTPSAPLPSTPAPTAKAPGSEMAGSVTRPGVPAGIAEFFLPNNLSFTQSFKAINRPYPKEGYRLGLIYRPVLLAQASVRFLNRKFNLDTTKIRSVVVTGVDRRGVVRWENFEVAPLDQDHLDDIPDPSARFAALEVPLSDERTLKSLQRDFADWVYRATQVTARANETLKVYAGSEVSSAEFRQICADAARAGRDQAARKVSDAYDRKLATIQDRLAREERELDRDESDLSQRKMEEMGTHAENVFNLFKGRSSRRLTTSLSKRRMTEQAKADVEESLQSIKEFKRQVAELEKEKEAELARISESWADIAGQVTETNLTPLKKDVQVEMFGVAWLPYHIIDAGGGEIIEVPGFGAL